jgi:hypothetical protein
MEVWVLRRCGLMLSAWLIARATELVHNIVRAIDQECEEVDKPDGQPVGYTATSTRR